MRYTILPPPPTRTVDLATYFEELPPEDEWPETAPPAIAPGAESQPPTYRPNARDTHPDATDTEPCMESIPWLDVALVDGVGDALAEAVAFAREGREERDTQESATLYHIPGLNLRFAKEAM